MIEMAIVGLGSWGLCVLERTVSRARRVGTPVRVHVVEPLSARRKQDSQPCAGSVG